MEKRARSPPKSGSFGTRAPRPINKAAQRRKNKREAGGGRKELAGVNKSGDRAHRASEEGRTSAGSIVRRARDTSARWTGGRARNENGPLGRQVDWIAFLVRLDCTLGTRKTIPLRHHRRILQRETGAAKNMIEHPLSWTPAVDVAPV